MGCMNPNGTLKACLCKSIAEVEGERVPSKHQSQDEKKSDQAAGTDWCMCFKFTLLEITLDTVTSLELGDVSSW